MMKSLRIKSLSIQALGVFKERATFHFETTESHPLIVIEGKNGCGKTTILQALQIVLYGNRYLGFQKREYQTNLLRLIRRDCFEEPCVQAEVTLESSGITEEYAISRSWSCVGNKITENFFIYKDGKYIELEESEWGEIIDSFLPASLADLFFFDGERIEQLADPEKMPEILRRATESLLGIGLVNSAINDIYAYERRTTSRLKAESTDSHELLAKFSEKSKELKELEEKLSIVFLEKATLQNKIDSLKKSLYFLQERNESAGLGAFKRAVQLEEKRRGIVNELLECKREGLEIADDPYFPLAMMPKYWHVVEANLKKEQKKVSDKKITDAIRVHDLRLLERITSELGESAEAVKKIIHEELESLPTQPKGKAFFLEMDLGEINNSLSVLTRSFIQRQENIKKLETQQDAIQIKLEQVPSEEQVERLFGELQNKEKELELVEEEFNKKESSIEELSSGKKRLEAEKNSLDTSIKKVAANELKTKHILKAAMRAKELLTDFKKELLKSKAVWLSAEITQYYKKILRKKEFIGKVTVSPESFILSVQRENGNEIHLQSLSAGERQMLATAVLKAIIGGSECSVPVMVDTPLARLDGEHRMNLVKDFYSCVSPQAVILSTDEEIRGPIKKEIEKYVSRTYSLSFNEAEQATKIEVKNV